MGDDRFEPSPERRFRTTAGYGALLARSRAETRLSMEAPLRSSAGPRVARG